MATTSNIRLTGVVLAGGKSRRMGRDKAEIEFHGQPMWLRQLTLLRSIPLDEYLISGRRHGPYAHSGVPVVEDGAWDCGPLGGLSSALDYVVTDGILVLAIDMPAVPLDLLREIRDEALRTRRSVIPTIAGSYEPLAAVYLKSAATTAARQIQTGDYKLQHFAATLVAQELAVRFAVGDEQKTAFLNWNTPEDLL